MQVSETRTDALLWASHFRYLVSLPLSGSTPSLQTHVLLFFSKYSGWLLTLFPAHHAHCIHQDAFSHKCYLSVNDLSYKDSHCFLIMKFKRQVISCRSGSSVIVIRVSVYYFIILSVLTLNLHMSCLMVIRCLLQLQTLHNVHI